MRKGLLATAICLTGLLCVTAVPAQHCAGVEIEIASSERRCLTPGAGQPFKDCERCPEMVLVPSGRFVMGAPSSEERHPGTSEREDQVQVTIAKPFAVGRFSVTRGEFGAFIAETGHGMDGACFDGSSMAYSAERSWQSPGFAQDDGHPAVCVSWNDAKRYLDWLATVTGKTYRLLSEAEREYVTRAGSTTPFWWGSSISTEQANYNGNVTYGGGSKGEWRKATVTSDHFAANPWGLYKVHGNVWKWTEDCWSWSTANADNPGDGSARATGDCNFRTMRGGSWNNYPHTTRSARRYMNRPSNRDNFVGFRVARPL